MKSIPKFLLKKNPDFSSLLILITASIGLTFVAAPLLYMMLTQKVPDSILAIWNRWDAPHYLDIARLGYVKESVTEQHMYIVFFPLYPLLIRFVDFIFHYQVLSALLVSNLAFIGAVIYLYRISQLESATNPLTSVFYFAIFPTAYFLHAPYTESLFMLTLLGSIYYARRSKWFFAGLFGFYAALTRVNGILLFPTLLVEYLDQKQFKWRAIRAEILWILLVFCGLGIYLGINYWVYGNAFQFMHYQKHRWYEEFAIDGSGLRQAIRALSRPDPRERITLGVMQLLAVGAGFVVSLWSCFRLRLCLGVFSIAVWLFLIAPSFWMSGPRYYLCLFPTFILLSRIPRHSAWHSLLTCLFVASHVVFLALYITGQWAF